MFQHHAGHTRRDQGFTLIELLVVIAIIAILAAILFPVFGRARENARRSSCQSNLKQIALGIKQYTQDYDERFPMWSASTNGWSYAIQPYVKSTQVLQCPSETTAPDTNPVNTGYSDYFYNSNLGSNVTGQNESMLEYSSNTVMNGDSAASDGSNRSNGGIATGVTGAAPGEANWFPNRAEAIRHLEGSNYSFADGHVKWLKPEKIRMDGANGSNFTFRLTSATNVAY
jgi:prepilin-type N-terminal cleavage/methylation domain-containing protein/prepilin-type processing-associated H-X9-DG protein